MRHLLITLLSVVLMLFCACDDYKSVDSSENNVESLEYPIEEQTEETVYITKSGSKYHSYGCQYLKKSCIAIDLPVAKARGYSPCSKCQ